MRQIKQGASVGRRSWWKTACAVCVLGAAAAIAAPAQSFKTLVDFDSTDGAHPIYTALVQGISGNLYGTTSTGGTNDEGTIFQVTPNGVLTTLHNFCAQSNCADGVSPAGLVLGTDGNFYGTTIVGGGSACAPNPGCGTVFKVTPAGAFTTLHSFEYTDGAYPSASLVQGADGNFYGTTAGGGQHANHCFNGCGTVFKITPAGKFTTVHTFAYTDGAIPNGVLIQTADGTFYSTTFTGGANALGTVFALSPGSPLTTLYSFGASRTDGASPYSGVVQGPDGNFYGTTGYGGSDGLGTAYQVTPSGTSTTIYSFSGLDGSLPYAGLTVGTDGNLYGVTDGAGMYNDGTVFRLTTAGTLTTLHSFASTDGANPDAALVQATNGNFYGTGYFGGSNACPSGCGTVFGLSAGLGLFLETLPVVGKVGRSVVILGTKLTGATSVTFNGTAATFTVVSATAIKTTVPVGATTGPVQVTLPGGTLTSNVNFRVEP